MEVARVVCGEVLSRRAGSATGNRAIVTQKKRWIAVDKVKKRK
jgi:hypothetical protein